MKIETVTRGSSLGCPIQCQASNAAQAESLYQRDGVGLPDNPLSFSDLLITINYGLRPYKDNYGLRLI